MEKCVFKASAIVGEHKTQENRSISVPNRIGSLCLEIQLSEIMHDVRKRHDHRNVHMYSPLVPYDTSSLNGSFQSCVVARLSASNERHLWRWLLLKTL